MGDMPLTSLAAAFAVGVGTCLLLLYCVVKYYIWKQRKEAEESEEIRLILDAPISEDQYLGIQNQMDGRSLANVVMHALEIRGFLHDSYMRGYSVYVEDEQGERELDFNFESEQTSNTTIH